MSSLHAKKCFGGINNVFVVFDIPDNTDEDNWSVISFFNNSQYQYYPVLQKNEFSYLLDFFSMTFCLIDAVVQSKQHQGI